MTSKIKVNLVLGSLLGSLLMVGAVMAETSSSTPPATPTPEQTCASGNGKWCQSSGGGSGWCSYSSSPCPAHDAPSCQAQSGEWCVNVSGGVGWCATNGATCPINDEAACTAKSRKWCKSQYGSGWCATSGQTCPAYDEASCKAQNGEWCKDQYQVNSGSGWCASNGGSCPVNDQATCTAKNRTWCPNQYGGQGWCASTGYSCNGTSQTGPTPVVSPVVTPNQPASNQPAPSSTSPTAPSTNLVTPVTPTPVFTWPMKETECKMYYGLWCQSSGGPVMSVNSGYCNMANRTCPTPLPMNQTRCWDNSSVLMGSLCPAMPDNGTDCKKQGKYWCVPSGGGSGWCSVDVCMVNPPAGKMSCPDGISFAAALTDCPKKPGEIVSPPVDEILTKCADGSSVQKGIACPDDTVSVCAGKGGVWCSAKTGNDKGYCSLAGACPRDIPPPSATGTLPAVNPAPLTDRQIKAVARDRERLNLQLNSLERAFKRLKEAEPLAKVAALRATLQAFIVDENITDNLQTIRDEIDVLNLVRQDAEEANQTNDVSERDRKLQEKALSQLQRNSKKFAAGLALIQARAKRLQISGLSVPAGLTDELDRAAKLLSSVTETATFDEARDAMEALRESVAAINDYLPALEGLYRLRRLIPEIQKEISQRRRELKIVSGLLNRLGLPSSDQTQAVANKLAAIEASFAQASIGDVGEAEPMEFLRTEIFEPLSDADNDLEVLRSLANLKQSVRSFQIKLVRYEAQVKRLERQNKPAAAEARALLTVAKNKLNEIEAASAAKLDADSLPKIFELFADVADASDSLDQLLKLNTPGILERELKRKVAPSESAPEISLPKIEQVTLNAYRLATYFRYPLQAIMGIKISALQP